jgi:cbb3-type cytochrome oxidase cytochrome c subunit
MNLGPLIFLAAFFALSASWFGLVLKPQMQIGRLTQTNVLGGAVAYPVARPGLAQQGLEVYRAYGCAQCHSKNINQSGTALEVLLTDPGTNRPGLMAALKQVKPGFADAEADALLASLPAKLATFEKRDAADAAIKTIGSSSAKAQLNLVPYGPDIARGWGKRRSVAEDYLFDRSVLLGSQRIGPDLSNVGLRQPDMNWHLRHLYAPRSEVKGSTMAPHPFLFEKRKLGRAASPEALKLTGDYAPPAGYEIVPRPDAVALAAYLTSLRADAPLFSVPMSAPAAAQNATNAPAAAGATNAAAQ